ncbi:hypothetical protein J6TS2_21680 [Heyndrickxia sporothermodurans]|nr:hypothetical protein J6TS2_21680 [Heyndrickxia sporothermodurans]
MQKMYIVFGGFSILIGIIILFCSTVITANLELVRGVGINEINNYGFSRYAIACFVLGGLFILLSFSGILKKVTKIL